MEKPKFKVGDKICKPTGDYRFDGEIRSVFEKSNGVVRVVAEQDGTGMLHIYSESQLELRTYENITELHLNRIKKLEEENRQLRKSLDAAWK